MSESESVWPGAYPALGVTAVLKARPEDFEVEEILGFEPDGEGEHLLVRVEKRDLDTGEVAGLLARELGLSQRAVSWAGRKDRHAVSRQYFSVQWSRPETPDLTPLNGDKLKIIEVSRHLRKLRPGFNRGNRFRLRLTEIVGDTSVVEERLHLIAARGVPNYFGHQRFGRGARNIQAARDMLATGNVRRVPHSRRSMLLSAARSYLFNTVLAERIRTANWDRLLPGELAMLEGSHSFFLVDTPTPELEARVQQHDISPSGPLPGLVRKDAPAGEALALEQGALAQETDLIGGLIDAGVQAARRSLRLMPQAFKWQWEDTTTLMLEFELPAGAYATVVVAELADRSAET